MKKELTEEMIGSDKKDLISVFRKYKDYNTVRRNLREAYELIKYDLEIQEKMKSSMAPIVQSTFFTIIILYARWFGDTKNKVKLHESMFFDNNSKYKNTHNYIIDLRNQCIAHNENDILGGDRVYFENDREEIRISSDFLIQMLLNTQQLEDIKKCIEIVHNKIDSIYLPKAEKDLKERLKKYNIE